MIYTERDKLAVIELNDGTDAVSFDVVAQVLLKKPSNMIYCILKGMLYGIISMGDIARAKEENEKHVAINKNFMRILSNEYMKARKIFCEKENINALPIVDENNTLLGEYVRWDDWEISVNLPGGGIRQTIKYSTHVFLVCPCNIFEKKQKFFEYFKDYLLSRGIKVECIGYSEIANHLGNADYILFTDEDELRAMHTLYAFIWDREFGKTKFFTYRQFLGETRYDISHKEMGRYLEEISKGGIYVLNLLFECNANNNEYYNALNIAFQKKYDAINKANVNKVYPDMYKEFFDDLYSEDYAYSITHIRYQVETISGLKMLKDCQSEFYNVENGERYTYGQPENFEKTIYFVGPCYIYGHHTEDKYTIESFLQKRLNESGYKIKVVNCGSIYSAQNTGFGWMRMKSLPLRKGDIVVYGDCRFDGIAQLNLLDVCKAHNIPAKWMTNDVRHCNHKINSVYADAVYDAFIPVLAEDVPKQGSLIKCRENVIETTYIERYFKDFNPCAYDKVGAIVMNCNPFTYGHRYLIEQAQERVDFLIIFVVEEDQSIFSFNERFAMVCEGIADLNNVKVVPSGAFILSQTTFPEYFIKAADEELVENIENDIRIFGERIAPILNIKYRFVGEEPEDNVTNAYNLAMKRILPENGIELVEIPRKEQNGQYISASFVRSCLEDYDLGKLDELIPESTQRIIFKRNY